VTTEDRASVSFRDGIQIVFLEKWKILSVALLTVLIALAGIYAWPETYETHAKILVKMGREVGSPSPTIMRPGQMLLQTTQSVVNAEIQMLNNRALITQVVDGIGVDELTYSSPPATAAQRFKYYVKLPLKAAKRALDNLLIRMDLKPELSDREMLIESVYKNLSSDPAQETNMLVVRLQWGDPEMAARLLSGIIEGYIDLHIEAYSTPQAQDLFRSQVAALRADLATAEASLAENRRRWDISELDAERELLLSERSIVQQGLVAEGGDQVAIETEVAALSSQAELGPDRIMEIDALTRNPVIDEIASQVAELEGELEQRRTNYLETSSAIAGMEARLAAARARLDEEVRYSIAVAIAALQRNLESVKARRAALESALTGLDDDLGALDAREASFRDVEQRIDILRENIALYERRAEESRINLIMDSQDVANVVLVEPPTAPFAPTKPRKVLTLALALAFAPFLGIAFGVAARSANTSILSERELSEAGIRLLATVDREKRSGPVRLRISIW